MTALLLALTLYQWLWAGALVVFVLCLLYLICVIVDDYINYFKEN